MQHAVPSSLLQLPQPTALSIAILPSRVNLLKSKFLVVSIRALNLLFESFNSTL